MQLFVMAYCVLAKLMERLFGLMKRIASVLLSPLSKYPRLTGASSEGMAPPPSPENDDSDMLDHVDDSSEPTDGAHTPTYTYLTSMSAAHREHEYEQLYGDMVQPLHKIEEPELAKAHPSHAEDIFAAHLRHTTFTAKVWVNYDSMSKKFFDDKRSWDCGKLVMPAESLSMLRGIDPNLLELNHVRLDIGTPFRTLFHMTIEATPSKLSVGSNLAVQVKPCTKKQYQHLPGLVRGVGKHVEDRTLAYGQKGLQLRDIEAIAEMLFRWSSEEELEFKHRYPRSSLWMDFSSDDENSGFVDEFVRPGDKVANGGFGQRGMANNKK